MLDTVGSASFMVSSAIGVFEGPGLAETGLPTGLMAWSLLLTNSLGVFRLSGIVTGWLVGDSLIACRGGVERFKGRRYVDGSA